MNKSIDDDVICNSTLSNPHHGGEIVRICSRKRIANLHNMDNGEFPNFDTGIYTGCNFRRGEIRNRSKVEGEIFPKETSQLATLLKQDDLKEVLVDAEAKGIKTHKERDKNNSWKCCHTSVTRI